MLDETKWQPEMERARELCRRLFMDRREESKTPSEPVASSSGYLRFPAPAGEMAASAAPGAAATPPAAAPRGPDVALRAVAEQPCGSWKEMLEWCIDVVHAEGAFLVNNQGLVMASAGQVPKDGFESTGAELSFSMEQVEKIDYAVGRLRWAHLDFDLRRLVGYRATKDENTEQGLILGLVNGSGFTDDLKAILAARIGRSLLAIGLEARPMPATTRP